MTAASIIGGIRVDGLLNELPGERDQCLIDPLFRGYSIDDSADPVALESFAQLWPDVGGGDARADRSGQRRRCR